MAVTACTKALTAYCLGSSKAKDKSPLTSLHRLAKAKSSEVKTDRGIKKG